MNGTVVRGYRVLSEVYGSLNQSSDTLLIPDTLFGDLSHIYQLIGMEKPEERMEVAVHLMNNRNPVRRMVHYGFEAEKTEKAKMIKLDPLCGYSEKGIALVSQAVLERYELENGERIAIHAVVPKPTYLTDL